MTPITSASHSPQEIAQKENIPPNANSRKPTGTGVVIRRDFAVLRLNNPNRSALSRLAENQEKDQTKSQAVEKKLTSSPKKKRRDFSHISTLDKFSNDYNQKGINSLSDEIIEDIFTHLDAKVLLKISSVCKLFYKSIKAPVVSGAIINRNNFYLDPRQLPDVINHCGSYIKHFNLADFFRDENWFASPQNYLDDIDLPALLETCTNVENVDLSGYYIQKKVFQALKSIGTQPDSKLSAVKIEEGCFNLSFEQKILNPVDEPSPLFNGPKLEWPKLTDLTYKKIGIVGRQSLSTNLIIELLNLSNLTILRFPSCGLNDTDIERIASHCSQIKILEITKSHLNASIVSIAKNCKNLDSLNLFDNNISKNNFIEFSLHHKNLKHLKLLDITTNYNPLPLQDIIVLAVNLFSLESLKASVNCHGEPSLFNYFGQTKLKNLELKYSTLTLPFAEILTQVFPNVENLNLSNNSKTKSQTIGLLVKDLKKLNTIVLQNSFLMSGNFTDFLSPGITTLTSLNVDKCYEFSNEFYKSLPIIFPALRQLSVLKETITHCGHDIPVRTELIPLYRSMEDIVNQLPFLTSCRPMTYSVKNIISKRIEKVVPKEYEYTPKNSDKGFQPKFW